MIKGYFKGKYAKCICASPQGQPQWYTGGQKVPGTTKDLSVYFDHSKPERNFTCKSSPTSGAGSKSALVVRFAFFEPNSLTIQSSSSTIDLCPHTGIYTNIRHTTTCWVSKDKISPAPDFRFTVDSVTYPGKLQNDPSVYKADFIPSPLNSIGILSVMCYVTNTITGQSQTKQTMITFRRPPLYPPVITFITKLYTGKAQDAPVVAFTYSPAVPEFQKGDTLRFECSATGNPPPSLTITRKATNQQLASVRRKLKQATLFRKLSPLDCLDTDEYVCSGQNNQGVNREEISVIVKCYLDAIVTSALFWIPTIFLFLAVIIASFKKEKRSKVRRQTVDTEAEDSFTAKDIEQLSFNEEVYEAATLAEEHDNQTLGLET
ncbi:hypothetical protein PoB_005384000 [Plakobranchus ocellatus]|uniref:Ig-like domain-containing protein n=1 Tax=Plakobranchus ocellatus TaxID=259542 RepID=A0AAV4C6L1_9GAST|nr:hypothetical protein PoB_005384000 [Plakobranchus ocellatus]